MPVHPPETRSVIRHPTRALLVLLPGLILRVIYAQYILSEPVFVKYPTLADQLLNHRITAPFSSSPVYIAWIAALIRVFGHNISLFRLIQFGLGLLSIVLITVIGSRLFNATVGLIAGAIYALYGPALVYEGDLVTAPVMIFSTLLTCYLFIRGLDKENAGWIFFSGVWAGISAGIRPTLLISAILCAGILFFHFSGAAKRLLYSGVFLIGVVIPIVPITQFNYHRSREIIPVTSSGGSVFYSSNNYRSSGLGYAPPQALTEIENRVMQQGAIRTPIEHRLFKYLAERASGKKLSYGRVSSFYLHEGLAYLRRNPGRAVELWIKKLLYQINTYEVRDTASLIHAGYIRMRKFPFMINFGVLFALALPGVLLTVSHRKSWLILCAFLLPHILSALLFYVNGRLRIPMVPFLTVFAGYTLFTLGNYIKTHDPQIWLLLIGIMGSAVLTDWSDDALKQHRDIRTPSFLDTMQGLTALKAGNLRLAESEFEKAIRLDPLGAREAYSNLARIHRQAGAMEKAESEQRKALGIQQVDELVDIDISTRQQLIEYQSALAAAYWRQGDKKRAVMIFNHLRELVPDRPDIIYNLALAGLSEPNPDWEKILDQIQTALDYGLKLNLESTRAYERAAQCLDHLNRPDAARAARRQVDWEKSLRFEPELSSGL